MPHVGSEIDANFYRLIHQMLESPREGVAEDRRSEKRRPFLAAQRIARWDGSRFPDADQFIPVQCRDLTRRGFSFVVSGEPRFSALVVEFGVPPHALYVAAHVVRTVPVVRFPSGQLKPVNRFDDPAERIGPNGEQGVPMYLVGCRFTRRLRRPS